MRVPIAGSIARRRRGRGGRNAPRGVIILCGSGLVAVLIATILAVILLSARPRDFAVPAAADPTCHTPIRVRVFVLDSSDPPISTSQATAVDLLLQRFLDEGRIFDRVIIGRLSPSLAMPLKVLWVGCDPGQEHEVSSLRVTPKEARRRRETQLVSKVREIVAEAKLPVPTPLSPIAESWSMLFKEQRALMRQSAVEKTVFYVTDALQNLAPPLPSAYRRDLQTAKAKTYFAPFVGQVANVRVIIGLLNRPDYKEQQVRHAKPWLNEFLQRSGVERIEWIDLW